MDYLGIVPRIPIDDKVEIVETLQQGGGPAATAIVTAQRLGAATAFIGAVGEDERGKFIVSELIQEGVDCRYIKRQSGKASPAAFCWVVQNSGKRSIAWTRGTTTALTPSDIPHDMVASSRILHLDGHHAHAALVAARLARRHNTLVVLDAGTILPGIDQILEHTDIIIASETFAHTYTGKADIIEALKQLADASSQWVVVTLGSKGCIAFDGTDIIDFPAFAIDVVDSTGAGDVFHGAFICKLLECDNLSYLLRFSSAVAALKCTQFGGRTGIPTLQQVERFLEEQ